MPEMAEYLQPTTTDHPDGIYRVVGTDESTVTLLRVGDAEGTRVHTGEIQQIDRTKLDGFETADEPAGRGVVATLADVPELLYFQFVAFAGTLTDRPGATAVALVCLVAGLIGDQLAAVPRAAEVGLILVGSLGLAALGSGRL